MSFAGFVSVGLAAWIGATGIAAIRTGLLPDWLGWASVAIAVGLMTPLHGPLEGIALVWIVLASVLLLSAAGVYALMSFAVAQRRREIGIRAALGADARRLLWSVFARATGQLAFGVLVGVGLALGADAVSNGEFMGTIAPVLVGSMTALITIVGLLAAFGPARRGLRLHPTQALREE